uniref:Uncharacterized protein n=1 Tax=Hippocampus comes TaxID=109280 RepID=A0A3Q2YVI8_HIPCM
IPKCNIGFETTVIGLDSRRAIVTPRPPGQLVRNQVNIFMTHIKLILSSNETGGSFNVKVVVTDTDRHRQVLKWIRENWTQFSYHIKYTGMCKKLDSLAKKKSMSILKDWVQNLKCHLYWCALFSQTPEEKKQCLACVDHLQNMHDSCLHPPITREKAWLLPGIFFFLDVTMFVNDVMKMSHLGQTSGVEAFHSVVNHFVPKMYYFSYKGMKSRIILAAMHYNENAGRPQNVTKEGIHSYCIVYPKYKSGGYSLRKILLDATYDPFYNHPTKHADGPDAESDGLGETPLCTFPSMYLLIIKSLR